MFADLLAGTAQQPVLVPSRSPTILVFDSGLGGLSVFAELRKARPDARFVYAADDAAFPYGAWGENALIARIVYVMSRLVQRHRPDLIVIACGTASTLVLPALRARFDCPVVGTVPAIKPAAALTRSGLVTVLATPGTVRRDYTRELIATYAAHCRVNLVGSELFAGFAEAELKGSPVPDGAIAAELAPCFVEKDGQRTDAIVLGCTHYPLLKHRFERVAPWPVAWIDPAPAIARRVQDLLGPMPLHQVIGTASVEGAVIFTGDAEVGEPLRKALAERGLRDVGKEPMPVGVVTEH